MTVKATKLWLTESSKHTNEALMRTDTIQIKLLHEKSQIYNMSDAPSEV